MPYIGINIGALAVKVVCLDGNRVSYRVVSHRGRALQVLQEILKELPAAQGYGVCGQLGHISEVAATEAALGHVGGNFEAVASLGGETFAVYLLERSKIVTALSHNQCAAGSGEFLSQQIGRLGLTMEEAIDRSFSGRVVPLASRCSVHCKSDITHKLNRKEAGVEDVLRTLHDSMADKVVSLLEKAQRPVRRLLLVGGLAGNRALVAALQDKLPETQITVLPESAFFEALGAALLTRDHPLYKQPHLADKPALGSLPPLAQYENHVTVLSSLPADRTTAGPLVLGVDAGSTSTKVVLLDPETGRLAASNYRRTSGDPVAAVRQCLRALVEQVGQRKLGLVAVTGSGRELIGAYLDTAHVYNEISAHAAGAARLDPEVDTIFEIGGQDAKYVLLRNCVPIDYAMNASCSAGTGSFLEECAQGDLGLPLEEISDVALQAQAPVQFKSTCAAFINSDIRAALQEGRSRPDVVAGLVYAVVHNYLAKVKGPRAVGQKVFFQGGLAMNRAVACAFAQCLGKNVSIPPHPELLGAVGTALLAIERTKDLATAATVDLAGLADPDMKVLSGFVCGRCTNRCLIDQFEVAGRRFPFGGRCTRFESGWKREERVAEAPDLVEARNALIFAPPELPPPGTTGLGRIGLPRALTVHSLYPLYSTFFSQLGIEVVPSGVDQSGALKANSGFCFPGQIAHGAVLDLIKKNVELIFLPQVIRMPNPHTGQDSYLCPITQASPYFLSKAFPGVTILSPILDFSLGYETSDQLIRLAETRWGIPRDISEPAYRQAVSAQLRVEELMHTMGRQALAEALADDRPTILLVGRSYNAFAPEASQSIARKFSSMGVRVIPGDCLPQEQTGPTAWHFPNQILNAVALAKRHAHLFVLYVSNFSCTIDAFTQSFFSSELGAKPYLLLEIDAHTADAGVQTRLEAFLDIIRNYRPAGAGERRFQPAVLGSDAVLTTSAGRRLALNDPSVRIYFPSFSYYHAQALTLAARWLGLNAGPALDLSGKQLEQGLRYTSGRECLPLPIGIGQMLEAHRNRQPGEVVGFYMLRGGAPCVVDCYLGYFQRFIQEHRLEDLFVFDPQEGNQYYGLSLRRMAESLPPMAALADLFVEMEQALRVVGGADAVSRLRACWDRHIGRQPSSSALKADLKTLIDEVAAIPHTDPGQCPRVVVTGDFFLRFSPAFMAGVYERYAWHGIILAPAGLNELLLYAAYAGMAGPARSWHLPPEGGRTVASACARLFRPEGKDYLASWAGYRVLKFYDDRYRGLFARTGLLVSRAHDVANLLRRAAPHISPTIGGEAIPTVGKGVAAGEEGYSGIIAVGPFNCLPFRISEAILKPYGWANGLPVLTYESDGFSVRPSFLRQVDVHIQQVLSKRPTEFLVGGAE